MAMTLDLPGLVERQIAADARREGVSAQAHASVLLQMANVLLNGPTDQQAPPEALEPRILVRDAAGDLFTLAIYRSFMRLWEQDVEPSSDRAVSTFLFTRVQTEDGTEIVLRIWRSDCRAATEVAGALPLPTDTNERRKLVDSVRGRFAHIPYSSEDFIRDKQAEIDLEERYWR